jgi:hypothetical protein
MLSPIPVISSFFAVITSELLSAIYFSLSFFQKLPLSVIQNIHISNSQLLLLFTFIFLLIQFISSKKRTYLFLIFCSGIFVCTLNITHKITSLKQRKIIFYNSTDNLVVHLISGASNYIINENKLNTYESTSIKNVCTYNHLQKPIYIKCNENYQDELLFKKNKFISFNGKNIIAGNEITKLPSNIFIDFIVTNKVNNITIINDTKLIKQTPFFMNDTAISNYFILKKEGAFIYKF